MQGEFCRVLTEDGLELQGLFCAPEAGPAGTTVVHTHGLDGNFYENRFVDNVADACVQRGFNFITFNNRGHDYISDFIVEGPESGGLSYRQIGGIHEVFEECFMDISTWLAFARARGTRRFVIQGHSHGALKAIYYLWRATAADIAGLILLSPSDDFGMQREALGGRFDRALALARDLIRAGKETELMPPDLFHYPISARSYHDIFRTPSPLALFNVCGTDRSDFPELASIRVPVLMLVGSVEEAFLGEPRAYIDTARALLENAESFNGAVIEGAPHNYLSFEAEVAERIGAWLQAAF